LKSEADRAPPYGRVHALVVREGEEGIERDKKIGRGIRR